jgi:hypothetical protein
MTPFAFALRGELAHVTYFRLLSFFSFFLSTMDNIPTITSTALAFTW